MGTRRPELLGEPALADARLPGDQEQAWTTVLGRPPDAAEPRSFVGAADKHRLPPLVGCPVGPRQQRLVRRARCCRWLDPELPLERGRAGVVDAQRPRRVAV